MSKSINFTLLFIISLLVYVASAYYKTIQVEKLFDNRESIRDFYIELGIELQGKAGLIVKNNNFDPIMPGTLLRVLLRKDDKSILSYKYENNNLTITTNGTNREVDIRDIVSYSKVSKNNNDYTIYLN